MKVYLILNLLIYSYFISYSQSENVIIFTENSIYLYDFFNEDTIFINNVSNGKVTLNSISYNENSLSFLNKLNDSVFEENIIIFSNNTHTTRTLVVTEKTATINKIFLSDCSDNLFELPYLAIETKYNILKNNKPVKNKKTFYDKYYQKKAIKYDKGLYLLRDTIYNCVLKSIKNRFRCFLEPSLSNSEQLVVFHEHVGCLFFSKSVLKIYSIQNRSIDIIFSSKETIRNPKISNNDRYILFMLKNDYYIIDIKTKIKYKLPKGFVIWA